MMSIRGMQSEYYTGGSRSGVINIIIYAVIDTSMSDELKTVLYITR